MTMLPVHMALPIGDPRGALGISPRASLRQLRGWGGPGLRAPCCCEAGSLSIIAGRALPGS